MSGGRDILYSYVATENDHTVDRKGKSDKRKILRQKQSERQRTILKKREKKE